MAKKTKKTSSRTSTQKAPAKKTPRTSASAARADGAAKTKRALAEAKASVDKNLRAIEAGEPKTTEAGSKTGTRKRNASKRPSGLDLAAKVLADSKEPLTAKQIAERTIAVGWKTNGKTPHATLYAAILREINAKGPAARFKKTDRGLFTAAGAKGDR